MIVTNAAAEFCKTQDSPAIKNKAPSFEAKALFTQDEFAASEKNHLPWGRPTLPAVPLPSRVRVLLRRGKKVPARASYRMNASDVVEADRINAFRTDPGFPSAAKHAATTTRPADLILEARADALLWLGS